MLPRLLVADSEGEIIDCPEYAMAGCAGAAPELPNHFIPLPDGSSLYTLPGRLPIGIDEKSGEKITLDKYLDEPVQVVAAFVAPAYTQLLRPAFEKTKEAPLLPLFCYTAVGWKDDKFWVSAVRIDESKRQDANQFSERKVKKGAREKNKFVSLNYFVFPGFTDQTEEWNALENLLTSPGVNMIQWRNLNIAPDWYIEEMGIDLRAEKIGMKKLLDNVKEKFPDVTFGYFNPYLSK